jgi:hypothetical protein
LPTNSNGTREKTGLDLEEVKEPQSRRLEEIPETERKKPWKDLPPPPGKGIRETAFERAAAWGKRQVSEIKGGAERLATKRAQELGLREPAPKRRADDIARLERKIAALQKRPKKSRQPVPGGRPKRPWIQSRRAITGDIMPVDPVEEVLGMGEDMLGMGGMADYGMDPFEGGVGMDVGEFMSMGEDMLGSWGPPRANRRSGRKKRR